jgi:hypothetical protein
MTRREAKAFVRSIHLDARHDYIIIKVHEVRHLIYINSDEVIGEGNSETQAWMSAAIFCEFEAEEQKQ